MGRPRKRRNNRGRLWDEEEVEKLIKLVQTYQIEQTWGHKNKIILWKALAEHMGRSPKSCQSKYEQLRKMGRVYDYGDD